MTQPWWWPGIRPNKPKIQFLWNYWKCRYGIIWAVILKKILYLTSNSWIRLDHHKCIIDSLNIYPNYFSWTKLCKNCAEIVQKSSQNEEKNCPEFHFFVQKKKIQQSIALQYPPTNWGFYWCNLQLTLSEPSTSIYHFYMKFHHWIHP
jgi:hypothetical protein